MPVFHDAPIPSNRTVIVLMASLIAVSLGAVARAQTSLDDVHIVANANAVPGIAARSGAMDVSGLHLIKTDVNLVLVPVSVTDLQERIVTGLQPENFQIFEDKEPQEIRNFSAEDVPVTIGIILDTSGSMQDKIDRVREAVMEFCENANPQDEFFLISFSEQPRLMTDFTDTPDKVEAELPFLLPKGRTALLDAIYLGLDKMKHARHSKKALLIISDGGDNHSRHGEKAVRAAAKESDVMVYTIGIFDRFVATEEEMQGPSLLSDIAESSGGRSFTLENPNDLPAIAHRIGMELRTQYVLAYRPQSAAHDGRWRKIKVRLRLPGKHSPFQTHSRSGYYAMAR